jgi:hypothetical protein
MFELLMLTSIALIIFSQQLPEKARSSKGKRPQKRIGALSKTKKNFRSTDPDNHPEKQNTLLT